MQVSQRTVTILLSPEAGEVLEFAGLDANGPYMQMYYVQDTDEMGLWVRVDRTDGGHLVFIRWEYVISMDLAAGPLKAAGFEV